MHTRSLGGLQRVQAARILFLPLDFLHVDMCTNCKNCGYCRFHMHQHECLHRMQHGSKGVVANAIVRFSLQLQAETASQRSEIMTKLHCNSFQGMPKLRLQFDRTGSVYVDLWLSHPESVNQSQRLKGMKSRCWRGFPAPTLTSAKGASSNRRLAELQTLQRIRVIDRSRIPSSADLLWYLGLGSIYIALTAAR